jgi:hypothetical protein
MGNQQSSVLATSQKTEQSFERSSDNKGQIITEKAILENQELNGVESQDVDLNETKTDSETDDESDEDDNDDEDDEGKLYSLHDSFLHSIRVHSQCKMNFFVK